MVLFGTYWFDDHPGRMLLLRCSATYHPLTKVPETLFNPDLFSQFIIAGNMAMWYKHKNYECSDFFPNRETHVQNDENAIVAF